ncbi:MAG: hypothetical protein JKY98_07225 [Gammaproteobacteria bacterium]|nr:hypothetical protein [Gammaproteobacteria bacterium]
MTRTRHPVFAPVILRKLAGFILFTLSATSCFFAAAQDDTDDSISSQLDALGITQAQLPLCFGMRDIIDEQALAICDALRLKLNVKARELSETWIRSEPRNPAAQFALAEVLYTVEANLPRALFHLTRAEELTDYGSLGRALASGNIQWHYLTLSQLSLIHQLMGDQLNALAYLDKIKEVYGQDVESFRGWPLIKLKEYDAARASANLVLQNSDSERERARAWNTLCAVELASLQPKESLTACDQAINEDENLAGTDNSGDTVYLTNASEVALSLLRIDQAEEYLDRATKVLNPESVADPWIYKLYLTMNQGRFDEARQALDRMLLWREYQVPAVTVMNRAEHLLASAIFLLLVGYPEEAARLTMTALNEPDRNGSFSADDAQKDSMAALLNMLANQSWYQLRLEEIATLDYPDAAWALAATTKQRFAAWRAGRKAASLFADLDILINRLRPYAPLDVHIPEWIEPEMISLMGTGVMTSILDQAHKQGNFMLNDGYYYAYATEIAFLEGKHQSAIDLGRQAIDLLPQQEVLLQARLRARMAESAWKLNQYENALSNYQSALQLDPGVIRRLGSYLPVTYSADGSDFSKQAISYLKRSPRFKTHSAGFRLEVNGNSELSACLFTRSGDTLSCYSLSPDESQSSKSNAQQLVQGFHRETFSLNYEISNTQISLLLGTSVIMSSQNTSIWQNNRNVLLER